MAKLYKGFWQRPAYQLAQDWSELVSDKYIVVQRGGRGVHLHRWLWEQLKGPVPAGMCVTFKNGKRADCRMCNLELRPKAEVNQGLIRMRRREAAIRRQAARGGRR